MLHPRCVSLLVLLAACASPRAATPHSAPPSAITATATQPKCPPSSPAAHHAQHSPPFADNLDPATGRISGIVYSTNTPLSDVTVIATRPTPPHSPTTQLTDATGHFLFPSLSPGTYDVVFYYGEIKFAVAQLAVRAGNTTSLLTFLDTTPPPIADAPAPRAPVPVGDFAPDPVNPNAPGNPRLFNGLPTGQPNFIPSPDSSAPCPRANQP